MPNFLKISHQMKKLSIQSLHFDRSIYMAASWRKNIGWVKSSNTHTNFLRRLISISVMFSGSPKVRLRKCVILSLANFGRARTQKGANVDPARRADLLRVYNVSFCVLQTSWQT